MNVYPLTPASAFSPAVAGPSRAGPSPAGPYYSLFSSSGTVNSSTVDNTNFLTYNDSTAPLGTVNVTPSFRAPVQINENERYVVNCNKGGTQNGTSTSLTDILSIQNVAAANRAYLGQVQAQQDAIVLTVYMPVVTFVNSTDRPMWVDGIANPKILYPLPATTTVQSNIIDAPADVNLVEIPIVDIPAVNVYTQTAPMALQDMATMLKMKNKTQFADSLQATPAQPSLWVCLYTIPNPVYRTAYGPTANQTGGTQSGTPYYPGASCAITSQQYLPPQPLPLPGSSNYPPPLPGAVTIPPSASFLVLEYMLNFVASSKTTAKAYNNLSLTQQGMYGTRFLLNGANDIPPTSTGSTADSLMPQVNCLQATGGGVVYATMPTFLISNDTDRDMVISGAETGTQTVSAMTNTKVNGITTTTVNTFLCAVADLPYVRLLIGTNTTPFMFNSDFSMTMASNHAIVDSNDEQIQGYLLTTDCSGCSTCAADSSVSNTTTWNMCTGNACKPDMTLTAGVGATSPPKRPLAVFNSDTPCSGCTICDDARYPVLFQATPPQVLKINGGRWSRITNSTISGPNGPYGSLFCASGTDILTNFMTSINPSPDGAIPIGVNADFILGTRPWTVAGPLVTQSPSSTSPAVTEPPSPTNPVCPPGEGLKTYSMYANGNCTPIPDTLGAGAVLCQTYWEEDPTVSTPYKQGTTVADILPLQDVLNNGVYAAATQPSNLPPAKNQPPKGSPDSSCTQQTAVCDVASAFCTDYFGKFQQSNPAYFHWPLPQPTPSPVAALHVLRPTVVVTNNTSYVFEIYLSSEQPVSASPSPSSPSPASSATATLDIGESYSFCLSDYTTPEKWYIVANVPLDANNTYPGTFAIPASVVSSDTSIRNFLEPKYPFTPGIFSKRFYLSPSLSPTAAPSLTVPILPIQVSLEDSVATCSGTNLLPLTITNPQSCIGVIVNDTAAAMPLPTGTMGSSQAVDLVLTIPAGVKGVQISLPQYQKAIAGVNTMAIGVDQYTSSVSDFSNSVPSFTFQVPDDPDNEGSGLNVYTPSSSEPWLCTSTNTTNPQTYLYYCTPTLFQDINLQYVRWDISRNYNLPTGSCIVQNELNAPYEILGKVYKGNGPNGDPKISQPTSSCPTCTTGEPPTYAPGTSNFIPACPCIGYITDCTPSDTFTVLPLDSDFVAGDPQQNFQAAPPSRAKQCTLTDTVTAMSAGDLIHDDSLALVRSSRKLLGDAASSGTVHCGNRQATNAFYSFSVLELSLQLQTVTMGDGGPTGGKTMTDAPTLTDAKLYGVYQPTSNINGSLTTLLKSGCGILNVANPSGSAPYDPPGPPKEDDLPSGVVSLVYIGNIPVSLTTTDNMTFRVRAPLPVGQDSPYIPNPGVNEIALSNTLLGTVAWSLWPSFDVWSSNAAEDYTTKALHNGTLNSYVSTTIKYPPSATSSNPAVLQVIVTGTTGTGTTTLAVLAMAVYSNQTLSNISAVKCTAKEQGTSSRVLCSRLPASTATGANQYISLTQLTSPHLFAVTAPFPIGSNSTVFPTNGMAVTFVNQNSFPVTILKIQGETPQSSLYDVNGNKTSVTVDSGSSYSMVGYSDSKYTLEGFPNGSITTGFLSSLITPPSTNWDSPIIDAVTIPTSPRTFTITLLNIVSYFTFNMDTSSSTCGPSSLKITYYDANGKVGNSTTLTRSTTTSFTFSSPNHPFLSLNEKFVFSDLSTPSASTTINLSQLVNDIGVFDYGLMEVTNKVYSPNAKNAARVDMDIRINCLWPIKITLYTPCAPTTCDFQAVVKVNHSVSSVRRLQRLTPYMSKKHGRRLALGDAPTPNSTTLTAINSSWTFTLFNEDDTFDVTSQYYGFSSPKTGPYSPLNMATWKTGETNGTVSLLYTDPYSITVLCLPPNLGPGVANGPQNAGYPPYSPPTSRGLPPWAIVLIVLGAVALLGVGAYMYMKYYGKPAPVRRGRAPTTYFRAAP